MFLGLKWEVFVEKWERIQGEYLCNLSLLSILLLNLNTRRLINGQFLQIENLSYNRCLFVQYVPLSHYPLSHS